MLVRAGAGDGVARHDVRRMRGRPRAARIWIRAPTLLSSGSSNFLGLLILLKTSVTTSILKPILSYDMRDIFASGSGILFLFPASSLILSHHLSPSMLPPHSLSLSSGALGGGAGELELFAGAAQSFRWRVHRSGQLRAPAPSGAGVDGRFWYT
jgi:hypothetical protein